MTRIRSTRARRALDGLSVGDAFGEQAFGATDFVLERTLPHLGWRWTDDTAMACSVLETLEAHGAIDQNDLALRFARRFLEQPNRGYGAGAIEFLEAVSAGASWSKQAQGLFGGQGSYGNGAAMRVAPVGAWFADDLDAAAAEARKSAAVTHAHVEGQEGAVAVALVTAQLATASMPPDPLLGMVVERLLPCETRERIDAARALSPRDPRRAMEVLGTGHRISAFDTVPFCVWVAAHFHADWDEALYITAAGRGDVDTTCAIVGGMIALPSGGPPASWLERREPLWVAAI